MKKWFYHFLEKWDQSRYFFRRTLSRIEWPIWLVVILVSAVFITHYFFQVDYPFNEQKHRLVLKTFKTAVQESRPLFFLPSALIFGLMKAADVFVSYRRAFILSCGFSGWLATVFFISILFKYLQRDLSETRSLIGILLAILFIPLVLSKNLFYLQPILETGLFTGALLCLYQKRYVWLSVLLVLGVLNGQWIYLIPIVLLLTYQGKWDRGVRIFIFLIGILVLMNFLIYWFIGIFPYNINPSYDGNEIQSVSKDDLVSTLLFVSSLSVFALLGFRGVKPFIKKSVLIVPLYALSLVFGRLSFRPEYSLILLPLLLPMALQIIPRSIKPSHHP